MRKLISVFFLVVLLSIKVNAETQVDLLEKSEVHPDDLEQVLYYELSGLSYAFADAEIESGVNAIALASIAAIESDWGRSERATENNNLFGWKNSDGDYMDFYSKEECILYVAKKLREKYLNEDGSFYHGDTLLSTIGNTYSGSNEWADSITDVYDGIIERLNEMYE